MQTYTHVHTHSLQAAVRQAGSHPAKSLIHMPSQPIQWDGVQVAQHIHCNWMQLDVENKREEN